MEEHGGREEASVRIVEEEPLPYRATSSISIQGMTGPRQVQKRAKEEADEPVRKKNVGRGKEAQARRGAEWQQRARCGRTRQGSTRREEAM